MEARTTFEPYAGSLRLKVENTKLTPNPFHHLTRINYLPAYPLLHGWSG